MQQYLPFLMLFCALMTAGFPCITQPGIVPQRLPTAVCDQVYGHDGPRPACTPDALITTLAGSITSTPVPTYPAGGTTQTGAGALRVSVLDVGQGDAILIQSPAGKTMLVDAGDSDAGSDVAAELSSRRISSLDPAATSPHAFARTRR